MSIFILGLITYIITIYTFCYVCNKCYNRYKFKDKDVESILKLAFTDNGNNAILETYSEMYAVFNYKQYCIKISIYEGLFDLCGNGEIHNNETNTVQKWHYLHIELPLWLRVKIMEIICNPENEKYFNRIGKDEYRDILDQNLKLD